MLEIYGKFCLVLQRFINFALNLHLDFGADCEPKKLDIHNHVGGFFWDLKMRQKTSQS